MSRRSLPFPRKHVATCRRLGAEWVHNQGNQRGSYKHLLMAVNYLEVLVVVGCSLALYLVSVKLLTPKRLPLPPGPFRWPIVGNVFDMPKAKQWIKFAEWQKVYGDP